MSRVPPDEFDRLAKIRRRSNAEKELPTVKYSSHCSHSLTRYIYSRSIISDDIGKLPDYKATIRSHTGQAIPINCHISHGSCGRVYPNRELQQSAIPTGPGNNAHSTYVKSECAILGRLTPSPFVMAYATQCVAPMVVPGKKVASCLTSAMAVLLTASLGA